MLQQTKQSGGRIAENKHLLALFGNRNIDRRHRAGHPLRFGLRHHARIADIAAALAAEFRQQSFIDPGKGHGGIGIKRAGLAQGGA